MPPDELLWICSQAGAREHYAIPRALHRADRLRELHTDLWSRGVWQAFRLLGTGGRAFADRFHPELRDARVHAYPVGGIGGTIALRRAAPDAFWNVAIRHQEWLDRSVRRHLPSGGAPLHFFSYTGTFLETARALRQAGGLRILGQVDPALTEERIVADERKRWPGWEAEGLVVPDAFHQRRLAEWGEADLIVVNSQWSRDALVDQGVPGTKLRVVPLVYEPPSTPPPSRPPGPRLRVLWLGQVLLRKGIQYLIDAAHLLRLDPVDIEVAGPVLISPEAVASAPPNLRFTGPIPRSDAAALYAKADLFVLPTLSDGFALTQLEAMAHGLPVVATPRCGEVVVPGENGLIVPPSDARALAEAIASLARDRDQLRRMSGAARDRARQFGLDRLRAALLDLARA